MAAERRRGATRIRAAGGGQRGLDVAEEDLWAAFTREAEDIDELLDRLEPDIAPSAAAVRDALLHNELSRSINVAGAGDGDWKELQTALHVTRRAAAVA